MKTKIAMALPTQGLNALTKINKIRPGVNISTSHATSPHNMQPPVIIRISFPSFQLLWQLLTFFWQRLSTTKTLGRVKSSFQALETSKQLFPSW